MDNVLSSIAGAIGSFAPTLATMLGGPFAGTAVTALEAVLGVKGSDKINALLKAGQLTPEQSQAIAAEDNRHSEILGQQKLDLVKVNADFQEHVVDAGNTDRGNARLRESNVKDNTPKYLAWMTMTGFWSIGALQLVGFIWFPEEMAKIPPQGWLLIGTIWGLVGKMAGSVDGYYFGSSSGADRGQELLAQSTPSAPLEVTAK